MILIFQVLGHLQQAGVADGLELFRISPFQKALAILSKLGEPGEEHTPTTMGTIREPTTAAKVRTLKASLD